MQKKQPNFSLTLHRKLVLSFSLSAALIMLVGTISYLYSNMQIIFMITSMSVAITMVTGFLIYRSITKPLDNIKSRVNEIASRNFEVEIPEEKRHDELGELARSIIEMKQHLREKDRQKDEFINIASHELRTPIQPIVAYVELAKKGVVPQSKAFEVISQEALRLKRLADDILDVSRIEGKRLKLNKEVFSVNEILAKITEETQASLKNGNVILAFSSSINDQSDRVNADKYRIMQVVTNIVNNAVKFTKKGSIEISTNPIDAGAAILISVSDTGPGIPDEIFPKLFEKFATMGVAEGTQNGTGLGLFISKAIIEAHCGSMAGLNNNKGGATFKVILPTVKGEREIAVADPKEVQENDLITAAPAQSGTHEGKHEPLQSNPLNEHIPTPASAVISSHRDKSAK